MNPKRVNIFNEADGNHLIFRITHNFKLQLFPSKDGLFHQNLSDNTCLQTACHDSFEFLNIVNQTTAGTAHRISGTQYHRKAELFCNGKSFFHTIGNFASCHLDSEAVHCLLKLYPVLTTFNRVNLDTNDLDVIFFEYSGIRQFRAQIQSGLSSKVRKQSIRSFFLDNLFQPFYIQRLNIGHISCCRVCHDGCRIGIDQYDFIPKTSKRLAGLCS